MNSERGESMQEMTVEVATPLTLKAWLAIREMKDKDFAKKVGVSPQAVSSWKSGRHKPSGEYVPKIESVLDVRFSEIKFESSI